MSSLTSFSIWWAKILNNDFEWESFESFLNAWTRRVAPWSRKINGIRIRRISLLRWVSNRERAVTRISTAGAK